MKRIVALAYLFTLVSYAPPLEVIRKIPHSGYSEGLDFHDGFLWHALPKQIVKINPKDGTVLSKFNPATEYSEGITWFQGNLWNVSYSDNGIYRSAPGEALSFVRVGTTPEVHAWGLTNDGKHLIMTGDYSQKIYFFDPKSVQLVRTISVSISDLEDLAWDGIGLWSSSFTAHRGTIFRIDPFTGKIGELFSLPKVDECPVIDGIAFDNNKLWLTGKDCSSIYLVKKPTERNITSPKKK